MADWLRIRNLGFSYGEKKIIDRFSFTAPVPGIVTCSGPSGCGKSTLGLLLSGHLTAQSGEIFLDENAVRRPSRRCIAVSQDDDLFPWMKMRDQLKFCASFPNTVADWGNLAKSLGMEAFEDLYPGEMSGGMRKRLALLRATVLMPRLLVLDETLVSVEPMLRHKIVDDFSAIWHSLGVGVLLISHDISPEISRHVVGEIRLDRK